MELYKNKALFTDAIIQASNLTSLPPTLIEKDYYVIYLLSELNKEIKDSNTFSDTINNS